MSEMLEYAYWKVHKVPFGWFSMTCITDNLIITKLC